MRYLILTFSILFFVSVFAEKGEKFLVINPGGHKGTIKSMLIDSKGKIITGGYDKTVKIWNGKEGILEREIFGEIGPGSEGLIYAMALSDDDKYLATAGWFGETSNAKSVGAIRLYDYKTGKQIQLLESHIEVVIDLEFADYSNYLFSLDGEGNVLLWVLDKDEVYWFQEIPKDILDIEPFNKGLLTAHRDGTVHYWDIFNLKKPLRSFKGIYKTQNSAEVLAVSPDYSRIAVSSANNVYILDEKLKLKHTFYHGNDPISCMNYSPDSKKLIVASSSIYLEDNLVRVYEVNEEGIFGESSFKKHSDAILGAGFISEDLCVTAGGRNNEIAVWKNDEEKKNGGLVSWMCGTGSAIHAAGMSKTTICFAKTWTKNGGFSAYEFVFDISQREQRKYTISDSGTYPILSMNNYTLKISKDLTELSLKEDNTTKAKIKSDFTNGSAHMVVSFVNENYFVSGGGYGALHAYDFKGQLVSKLVGHEGDLRGLAVSEDGKFLVSGSQDQTIRLWKIDEIGSSALVYPTLSLFAADNNEWVVWNEEGYFMSSKKGASYVGFHINYGPDKEARFYPFEQFDAKYNRPDLILESLGFVDPAMINLYHSAYLKRLSRMGISESDLSADLNAPSVTLKMSKPLKGKVMIDIIAIDTMHTLKSLHIYLNDVPVFGRNGMSLIDLQTKKLEKSIELELMSGINKIQVSVTNSVGADSFKETNSINNTIESSSELYVVSVGVSNYKDSIYNLEYAAKDAEDVNALFGSSTHFKKVNQKVLLNSEVTRSNLVELKTFLSQAKRDDIVIFFIAGHGVLNKTLDYYYCTYDMDFLAPEKFGVSYSELEILFDGIKAIRKLLIMDTCHSGEVDKNDLEEIAFVNAENDDISFRSTNTSVTYREAQGLEKTNEAVKEMFNDLRRGTGATVLSSAGGAEYAMESDQWKNGLFTYCLLEGLQTKNADADKNGEIMLSELQNYISSKVAEISNGRQMPTSRVENLSLDYRIW
jgi:WD40 repeat protein